MPVYLFTYHAYRSWLPDRKNGYVERGKGILPQDLDRARAYREIAAHDPVVFDDSTGWSMIGEAERLCAQQSWKLYEAASTTTHIHLLVGWKSTETWKRIATRIKQRLGAAISRCRNRPGPWFSRGHSRKQVRDRKHFEYLLKVYLPRHGLIRLSLSAKNRKDRE